MAWDNPTMAEHFAFREGNLGKAAALNKGNPFEGMVPPDTGVLGSFPSQFTNAIRRIRRILSKHNGNYGKAAAIEKVKALSTSGPIWFMRNHI